jgi:hypothetical protein
VYGFRVLKYHVICPPDFYEDEDEFVRSVDEYFDRQDELLEDIAA